MVDFTLPEFQKADGSTDWEKLRAAEVAEKEAKTAAGELCSRCSRYIVWAKGVPQVCSRCKDLDDPQELDHPADVRCPACGHHWTVGDGDYYELFDEGEHEVSCGSCDHDFVVSTMVSHTFTSPERLK